MRVAYICTDPGVPIFGTKGCSVHVEQVVRSFVQRGCHVDLYARRFENDRPTNLKNVTAIRLQRVEKSRTPADRELRLIELDRQLALALRRHAPYDLVYERHALWSAAGMEFASDEQIPSILEVNAPLLEEQSKYRELIAADKARELVDRSLNAAQSIVAVSQGVANYLRSFSVRNAGKVHVVPNGVNLSAFESTAQTINRRWGQRRPDRSGSGAFPVIGFVGTLRAWHGMTALGQAFRQFQTGYPKAQLLVIGDGPAREELLAALGRDAAQQTTITGKVPHGDVAQWMAQIDIATAPYPDIDNFYFSPLKILEYMACGLPMVASCVGDIPKLLDDGKHGSLVAPGRSDEISQALDRIAGDPRQAMELGTSARDAACRLHSWDRRLDEMLPRAGIGLKSMAAVRSAG